MTTYPFHGHLSKVDTSTVSSKHIWLQHHKSLPENEDWKHILKFVWREVPEFWQTVLVQSHPKFLQSHQGTSPERLYTPLSDKFSCIKGVKWQNPNKKGLYGVYRNTTHTEYVLRLLMMVCRYGWQLYIQDMVDNFRDQFSEKLSL